MEVKEFINENQEMLLRLDRVGVKTISTALDYLLISNEFEKHKWIDSVTERKKVVATRCKVSIRTVEESVRLMQKKLK